MGTFSSYASQLSAGTFVFTAVVAGLVLGAIPLWAMVDCATDIQRPSRQRAAWVCFILFAVVLGPLVYCLFASRNRWLKAGIGLSMSGTIALIFVFFSFLGPARPIPPGPNLAKAEAPKPAKPARGLASPKKSPKKKPRKKH